MPIHLSSDHATPGCQLDVAIDQTNRARKLKLFLIESQIEPRLDEKTYRRDLLTVDVPAGAETVALPLPIDLPPNYAGKTIGWRYEVVLDDDAAALVIDRHPEPLPHGTADGEPIFDGSLLGGRNWVERGAEPVGGTNRVTVLGSLGLGALLLLVGVTAPSIFGLLLGVALLAIGLWFGRDLAAQIRHSLRDVEVVGDEAIVPMGEPVRISVDPKGRDGLEVGLVAVELSLLPHRQTIVRETAIERWAAAESGDNEVETLLADPPTYQGNHIALHWYVGLRDGTLSPEPKRLTQRQEPLVLHQPR
ncbi:MAG: hypothetical protein ACR2QO_28945 [Acidimicrobiales bacterium]